MSVLKGNYIVIFSFVVVTLFFGWMNFVVPFYSDDYAFMYSMLNNDVHNQSLSDVINSTRAFYFSWNGRVIPNFIGFFVTSLLSDSQFNVANTIIYILLIGLVTYYLFGSFKNIPVAGFITLIIGLFLINRDDLFYWAIGSANYLWPLPILMLLFLLVNYCLHASTYKWYDYFLVPFVFIMSFTHEGYMLPFCGAIFFSMLYTRNYNNRLLLAIAFSAVLATGIMVLNPGSMERLLKTTDGSALGAFSLIKRIWILIKDLRVFYLVLIVFAVSFFKSRASFIRFIKDNHLLVIFTILGVLPGFLTATGGRALLCAEFGSVMLLAKYIGIRWEYLKNRYAIIFLSVFLCIWTYVGFYSYMNWKSYRNAVTSYVNSKNNTVLLDDSYNYAAYTLPHYIMNMDNLFNFFVKERLQKEKRLIQRLDTCEMIQQLPLSVYTFVNNRNSFSSNFEKLSGNVGFYTSKELNYYVAENNSNKREKIEKGCLSFSDYIPFIGKELIVNIASDEVTDGELPISFPDNPKTGKLILYNKNYKNFPFTKIKSVNLLEEPSDKKFEIR